MLRLIDTRIDFVTLTSNGQFCCELMVDVPDPADTGTDPTISIVGARGWLAGWRLPARRRIVLECIFDYLRIITLSVLFSKNTKGSKLCILKNLGIAQPPLQIQA